MVKQVKIVELVKMVVSAKLVKMVELCSTYNKPPRLLLTWQSSQFHHLDQGMRLCQIEPHHSPLLFPDTGLEQKAQYIGSLVESGGWGCRKAIFL